MCNEEFHTFKEDMYKKVTASMEDYIEMIYRLSKNNGFVRINELADKLHVKPSSVTKMVQKLSELDYIKYQKYGVIILKSNGYKLGKNLLERHITVENLLKILKVSNKDILNETEKIEHTLNDNTYKCISKFVMLVKNNGDLEKFLDNNL